MEKPPRGKGILIHLLLPFCCSKMLLAIIFLQISPQALAVSSESHWTYEGSHGQEHWPDTFPDCGWKAQSPVDIQMGSVQYDPSLPPIEPEGYWNPGSGDFTLINNGHTVQMSLPPSMRLHGLPSDFSAVQLHFHWGGKGHSKGSEHKVDGKSFPAELHVVHFNSEKYRNVSVAKHQPDGLAVLGIFLEAGDVANPAYDHILDHLDKIQYAGELSQSGHFQEITIAPFNVRNLLPAHLGHYFRYNGSLTTPPCSQNVLWTVFHQPAHISVAQLETLQKSVYCTEAGEHPAELLVDNFRAPQPLNQRVVFSSFSVGPSGYSAGEIVAIIFGVILGCLSFFLAGWMVAKRIR
ncbi:carbonic anhydrase 14 isoform X2 [Rhineura floridana]|uniref:carbonic anhydrase 14 isoform X2 n=1 Tax=Rhineura floridana TaxID=261503 RepID=UPI002AC85C24|nr:carbonic anhydrase 14 isoform X2 [Rhineura floridana]